MALSEVMLPTPRTDAEAGYYDGSGCWHHRANGENVDSDFARTLERELTAARAELKTYRESCAAKADRIAQAVFVCVPPIEWEEVAELGATVRGEGGFGSTGR